MGDRTQLRRSPETRLRFPFRHLPNGRTSAPEVMQFYTIQSRSRRQGFKNEAAIRLAAEPERLSVGAASELWGWVPFLELIERGDWPLLPSGGSSFGAPPFPRVFVA
jgi:hypothetical protein